MRDHRTRRVAPPTTTQVATATHFICQVYFLTPAIALRIARAAVGDDAAMPSVIVRTPSSATARELIIQSIERLRDEVLMLSDVSLPHSAASRGDAARGLCAFDPPSVHVEDYELFVGAPDGSGIVQAGPITSLVANLDSIDDEVQGNRVVPPALTLPPPHYTVTSQVVLQHNLVTFPYTFVVASAGLNLGTITAAAPKGLKARLVEDFENGDFGVALTVPGRTKLQALADMKESAPARAASIHAKAPPQPTTVSPAAAAAAGARNAKRRSTVIAVTPPTTMMGSRAATALSQLAGSAALSDIAVATDISMLSALGMSAYDIALYGEGADAKAAIAYCLEVGPQIEANEANRRRAETVATRERRMRDGDLDRARQCEEAVKDILDSKDTEAQVQRQKAAESSLDITRRKHGLVLDAASRAHAARVAGDRLRNDERLRLSAAGLPTADGPDRSSANASRDLDASGGERKRRLEALESNLDETVRLKAVARAATVAPPSAVFQGPLSAALHADAMTAMRRDDVAQRRAEALRAITRQLDDGCAQDRAVVETVAAEAVALRRDRGRLQDETDFVRVAEARRSDAKKAARALRNDESRKVQVLRSLRQQ